MQTITSPEIQVWSDLSYSVDDYPFINDSDPRFNVSWTGPVSMALWATSGDAQAFFNSTQITFSPALRLAPFKEYSISLTVFSYKINRASWLYFRPEIQSAVESASNSTLAMFDFVPYQQVVTQIDMTSPSIFVLVVRVLSGIGGTYAFLDGLFALIFGRVMVAILFGTRIISPFGLLGIVARRRFRRLINEQYPRLQEDINRGGMAAYISEIAIDAALVATPETVRIQVRAASLDSGSDEDGGSRNSIGLRRMDSDPRKNNSSGSVDLGRSYEIVDLQLSGRHNYEVV
ncbi:hypothetical protein HWV62_35180 [Athelia sp. TMB]|nr:hypothetical protein HWV62_35180 [Athelia sp. TMB]